MPNTCWGCDGYLCLGCWNVRSLDAPSVTWKQQINQSLARAAAQKSFGIILILLSAAISTFAAAYSTNFNYTENPISHGGKWISGGTATGGAFGDIATNGIYAYGKNERFPYGDPNAFLSGTWPSDQTVTETVHTTRDYSGAGCCYEVEIHLRFSASGSNEYGYEVNCSLQSSPGYIHIGSWDGPEGSFHAVAPDDTSDHCANGDVLAASIIGSTIKVYLNGSLKITATDTTCNGAACHTSGAPGLGTYVEDSSESAVLGNFGFSDFRAMR
jgi:hypothetical protein